MRDLLNKYKKLITEDSWDLNRPTLKEEKELSDETEMEEFAEKRGNGAEKISDSAKEKGGLSLLTYNHFRVKLPYYKKPLKVNLVWRLQKKNTISF